MTRTGTCLCGACSFSAEPYGTMQACHCDMCRTWGGGPFMAVPCREARFEGPITTFASSDHADRGFCTTCGTHLFFYAKAANAHGIPVGLFDDPSDLPFKAELYIDRKPDFYEFANETKQMTGVEFEARFR